MTHNPDLEANRRKNGEFGFKTQTETAEAVREKLQRQAQAATRRMQIFSAQTIAVSILNRVETAAYLDLETNYTEDGRVGWYPTIVADADGRELGRFDESVLLLEDGTEIEFDEAIDELAYDIPEERPNLYATLEDRTVLVATDPGYGWLTIDGDDATIDLGRASVTRYDAQAEVTFINNGQVALYNPEDGEFEFEN